MARSPIYLIRSQVSCARIRAVLGSFNFPIWISEQRILIQLVFYIGILAAISVTPLILWFVVVFRPKRASASAQPDQISEL